MSIPNYLYALANHKGPATVTAGGMTIPVKIMDIDHDSRCPGESPETKFQCLVVNEDKVRFSDRAGHETVLSRLAKNAVNAAYGSLGARRYVKPFAIDSVKFGKTTTVRWADGTSTSIICPKGDPYSEEYSLALCFTLKRLGITKVVFDDPVTVTIWEDGVKTSVRVQEGDAYSKETGLALCITKESLGNKGNFNNVFHEWIPEEEPEKEAENVEGCIYCRFATRTDEDFKVHTPSGAVVDAKFNWCPVCGREIPKREETANDTD